MYFYKTLTQINAYIRHFYPFEKLNYLFGYLFLKMSRFKQINIQNEIQNLQTKRKINLN